MPVITLTSDIGQADFITLQCHPMLAAFYGKVGFERVGAVEAWSRSQGRIPVDATEAALISAVCGADPTRAISASMAQRSSAQRSWRLAIHAAGGGEIPRFRLPE